MPKRQDIKKILIVGAGPIVIGQACEFDYSGTQACKALKQEGFEVVLVNSNPATIMTDPELADKTYIEPITPDVVRAIIEKERPDALLPTMGGQTSLNIAVSLAEDGTLDKYNVELIGAKLKAIKLAEDRALFKKVIEEIGLESPRSQTVCNFQEGLKVAKEIGFPVILRPAFTLGGSGGGIAGDQEEFESLLRKALAESPTSQVLLEEDLRGWKEFELEVVRDLKDNVAIICSIENFDPMGVHTGDSITVAPSQTLSDSEYQNLRNQAIKIIRAVGVESGGSNIQFAVNPENGKIVVIEMNPRVSRSSALASKATGYPIAKIAAKLAVGYSLDELPNEITKTTSSAFEPSIDYVVTKIPRFAFQKFPGAENKLGTQMKSVGEVMAVGRTFRESFQKALRGLETGWIGFGGFGTLPSDLTKEKILNTLSKPPSASRVKYLWQAFSLGASVEEIFEATKIDKWFLTHLQIIHSKETQLGKLGGLSDLGHDNNDNDEKLETLKGALYDAKKNGFSDAHLAKIFDKNETEIRQKRYSLGVKPVYKMIDTCAGEIESSTPYYYSTYEQENEVSQSEKQKVVIVGGGPNRIGQGIEFDYCCVHASMALREAGFESIMINSNPETVSTDFDTSDRLYFEPVTVEDVLAIYEQEKPLGVIVQLGGQTPLNISKGLKNAGVNILGTSVEQIDRAENRDEFANIVRKLNLRQPSSSIANSFDELAKKVEEVGYPVLVRPSFVIGGQSMQTIYDKDELESWVKANESDDVSITFPILIDKFLDDAIELDVDSVSDGKETVIAGILEHIERAGIHSGDSSCSLPTQTLDEAQIDEVIATTKAIAKELNVIGLMNVQYALKDKKLYVLEVNPRASRTVPFVSKVTGIPWAKIGTLLMVGKSLSELNIKFDIKEFAKKGVIAVKEAVLPFKKFPGCEITLGPEMRSTGEVMGIDKGFGMAFAKGQVGAGQNLNSSNLSAFLSLNDSDKEHAIELTKTLQAVGYKIYCTEGTHNYLKQKGIETNVVRKAKELSPNILNYLMDKEISLLINIPKGKEALRDNMSIRRLAILMDLPLVTTLAGAKATAEAIKSLREKNGKLSVTSLQEYQRQVK